MKSYEFGYGTQQFERIISLAKQFSGIDVDHSKRDMIYTRLVRLIRSSPYTHFNEFIDALENQEPNLNQAFINAITTNLTSFFREKHHFELLKNIALPEIMKQKKSNKTIKIWSAGCSSGEEPYSILFSLNQFFSNNSEWNYKVYASDIDTNVLNKATLGVYDLESISNINSQDLHAWFLKGVGVNDGLCRVKPEYRKAIDFFQCNLTEPFNFDTVYDVIFCRNVLIYFNTNSQKMILDQFMKHLAPNGFIFTGHSEAFMYRYNNVKLIAKTMYRKIS